VEPDPHARRLAAQRPRGGNLRTEPPEAGLVVATGQNGTYATAADANPVCGHGEPMSFPRASGQI
jgi:hypothetical protein